KMARPGLLAPLRAALAAARKEMAPVRKPAGIDQEGAARRCDVVVVPFTGLPQTKEPLFLVLFEDVAPPATTPRRASGPGPAAVRPAGKDEGRVPQLEHE